ncbi:MAG: hypothetical protein IPK63_19480 [Candidatus Competibacteraceae bacterium]|nr:hypothetical protein [Candidatus Competibacteraceae bacterium]
MTMTTYHVQMGDTLQTVEAPSGLIAMMMCYRKVLPADEFDRLLIERNESGSASSWEVAVYTGDEQAERFFVTLPGRDDSDD